MVLSGIVFILATIHETEHRHRLTNYLGVIDVSDGISESEADAMAQAYFSGYLGACGGAAKATLTNGEWTIPVMFGYGGKLMEWPIRINAKTGAISQVGGPAFSSYRSFRFILLWGIPLHKMKYELEEYYFENWTSHEGETA